MPETYWYRVCVPSEKAAGIIGFTDTVSVMVESGKPGGEPDGEYSFKEEMRKALCEWYDVASVEYVEGDCCCVRSKYAPDKNEIIVQFKTCPIHGY